MTKQEFDEKFKSSYQSVLQSTETKNLIEQTLKSKSVENEKITQEAVLESVFQLSLTLNQRILRSVLSNILEFDD